VSPEARKAAGISDGLVRIAVGLENPDDLIRDLQGGLKK
jgi:O-succinylhomoserine sulfhydrylase